MHIALKDLLFDKIMEFNEFCVCKLVLFIGFLNSLVCVQDMVTYNSNNVLYIYIIYIYIYIYYI